MIFDETVVDIYEASHEELLAHNYDWLAKLDNKTSLLEDYPRFGREVKGYRIKDRQIDYNTFWKHCLEMDVFRKDAEAAVDEDV